jgi:hypothetical protein
MEAKEKAEELVNSYRIILMNEDTECGNEILCTSIAKQCALIAVQEIINANPHSNPFTTEVYSTMLFWQEVKNEINNL